MSKQAWIAGLGMVVLAATASGAFAQARSPVDSSGGFGGGGNHFVRCSDTKVHKFYRLTVCDDGRYTVRGGGLSCGGTYGWQNTYGGVRINLRRAPCGSGTDWSGDMIRCDGFAWNRPGLVNNISSASCTYFPTREANAEGYGPEPVYFR